MINLTALPVWQQLGEAQRRLSQITLRQLFAQDAQRTQRFSGNVAGLHIDYAKNLLDDTTWQLLFTLAEQCDVPQAIRDLQAGAIVNVSEHRPALHSALRQSPDKVIQADGKNIMPAIAQTLAQMADKIAKIHQSTITDIINIGIGGSDLGPVMASQALRDFAVTSQRLHFVSTLDANQITALLPTLVPEKTLIIISSKSFTTEETLVNATVAKAWLGEKLFAQHAWAVTTNAAAASEFGIARDNIFPFWSWVGGRYSLWSAIGLPVAIQIGMENFLRFLEGGRAVDDHVATTPFAKNLPVILGLLNVWYTNFWAAQTHAVLPYDSRLARFPAYLQQLEMESNGKCVQQDNQSVTYATSPVVWGDIGTNGQHAFHQLLHQGTVFVPVDFIISRQVPHTLQDQHRRLWSHCLSQARILMTGDDADSAYRHLPGNRPSTMIVLPELTPYSLGALIALYEYKVFVSATVWQINPFDQWGVEKGKQLAGELYSQLQQGIVADTLDSSTAALMRFFLQHDESARR